jgi:hypothetical protein
MKMIPETTGTTINEEAARYMTNLCVKMEGELIAEAMERGESKAKAMREARAQARAEMRRMIEFCR